MEEIAGAETRAVDDQAASAADVARHREGGTEVAGGAHIDTRGRGGEALLPLPTTKSPFMTTLLLKSTTPVEHMAVQRQVTPKLRRRDGAGAAVEPHHQIPACRRKTTAAWAEPYPALCRLPMSRLKVPLVA